MPAFRRSSVTHQPASTSSRAMPSMPSPARRSSAQPRKQLPCLSRTAHGPKPARATGHRPGGSRARRRCIPRLHDHVDVNRDLVIVYTLGRSPFGTVPTVAFDVAYQSYLPSLITRSQLVEGNSKLELSRSVAQIAGPGALGRASRRGLTAPYAVAAGAVSFVASATFLYRIRSVEPPPERHEQTSIRTELIEGLRYLFGDPRWRAFSGYVATINFFSSGLVFSILLVFAVRDLGLSTAEIGLISRDFQPRVGRRSAGSRADCEAAWSRSDPDRGGRPLRHTAALPAAGDRGARRTVRAPAADRRGIRDRPLQRDRHQLRAGCRPRPHSRADDGFPSVCRLGNHPASALSPGEPWRQRIGLRETILVGAIGSTFCFLFLLFSPFRSIRDTPVLDIDAALAG